jgi:hypothetical protein
MKYTILLVLSLAGFGAGCASPSTWHPVQAEVGLVYDSPRKEPSQRWPNASFEYYRQAYWAPEIVADINQHQRLVIQGVETPFVSSLDWPNFGTPDKGL